MENKKNVAVKDGGLVNERIVRACLDMLAIYAQNNGMKGMVLFLDATFEAFSCTNDMLIPLLTANQCVKVWDAVHSCGKED